MLKRIWYYTFKVYIKTALFFYSKKTRVSGLDNIPKKGAVLFTANHPNGLIDPLFIATHNPRILHFLVRAAVFKNPIIKKLLSTLNLMPIFRIRDGIKSLGKNEEIFNQCYSILNNKKALLIFPEGSHDKRRTIRPISKGFVRIVFGALEKYPDLDINIIPIGLTYQKSGQFPSKVAIHYGAPILANPYYNNINKNIGTQQLKEAVTQQLQSLSVHIPNTESYSEIVSKLNTANVDFTVVNAVNKLVSTKEITSKEKDKNYTKGLKLIYILNTLFPWLIWKKAVQKIDEIEFIDTFRFAIGAFLVPLYYSLQSYIVYYLFDWKIGLCHFIFSIIIALLYSKFTPTTTL